MIDHLSKSTRREGGTLGIIRCEGVWCTEVHGRPNETLEAGEQPEFSLAVQKGSVLKSISLSLLTMNRSGPRAEVAGIQLSRLIIILNRDLYMIPACGSSCILSEVLRHK